MKRSQVRALSTCGNKASNGSRCELPAGHEEGWFHVAGDWCWSSGDPRVDRWARERRSQVRALLRKARATMRCSDRVATGGQMYLRGCAVVSQRWVVNSVCWWQRGQTHTSAASALLDGLSVRDVTEAGG